MGFCVGIELNDSEELYIGESVLLVAKFAPILSVCLPMILVKLPPKVQSSA